MKTKVAKRIIANAEAGTQFYPLHILRKAAMQVGRPISLSRDIVYYPKGLNGSFSFATKYRPYRSVILPTNEINESEYDYVHELKSKPGELVLDATAGSHISSTCRDATAWSHFLNAKVSFDFNGIKVTARPVINAVQLETDWHITCEERRLAYLASPEHAEQCRKDAIKLAGNQAIIDQLIVELPTVVDNQSALMEWIAKFANPSDNVGVVWDRGIVKALFESAGYVEGQECTPEDATEQERLDNQKRLESNTELMGNYIAGQVLSCIARGMGPHPVVHMFLKKYNPELEQFDKFMCDDGVLRTSKEYCKMAYGLDDDDSEEDNE